MTRSRSERGNAVMISFLRQLDVPEAILALIEKTEPTAMHWINRIEATEMGLSTPVVTGAWFSNNFTLRRGQLFYNGVPCTVIGDPLGIGARFPKLGSSSREDRCRDILQDREIAETPQQQADYDRCMKQASKPAPRSGEECGGHDTHGNECD